MKLSLCSSILRGVTDGFLLETRSPPHRGVRVVRATRSWAMLACVAFLIAIAPASSIARGQAAPNSTGSGSVKDPVPPQSDEQSSKGAPSGQEGVASAPGAHQQGASIAGTVIDTQGAVIPGATVTLEDAATHEKKAMLSDGTGAFTFFALKEGLFSIAVEANGFGPELRTGVWVHKDEKYELAPIGLRIAVATSTVEVSPRAQYELAEAQIKAEERQRLLSIFPNFYVSYVANPAPLTPGQKIRLAFRDIRDPVTLIGPSLAAGVGQARNTNPGYGQGLVGYGKRYGAAYGNEVASTFVGRGVVPALLHQDPRYFYKGTGSVSSRMEYALFYTVRIKGDDGRWQPNYSAFVGDLAAGAISNSYLPASDRKGVDTVVSGAAESAALRGVGALLQEFLTRWVSSHAKDKGTIGHE